MADPSPQSPDSQTDQGAPRQRGALAVLFRRCVTSLNALGSGWIFALMVLIVCDAIGRTFFDHPLLGVIEITQASIVSIVFLQLSDALRIGKLTRSDGVFNFVLARRPKAGRTMGAVFDLLGAAFAALVLYGSVPLLFEAWTRNYYMGEEGLFVFPTWPIKVVVVIGSLVLTVQFLVFAWRYAAGTHDGQAEPPAQPMD